MFLKDLIRCKTNKVKYEIQTGQEMQLSCFNPLTMFLLHTVPPTGRDLKASANCSIRALVSWVSGQCSSGPSVA